MRVCRRTVVDRLGERWRASEGDGGSSLRGSGGAAVWPLVAGAQHPKMPVVGYLGTGTRDKVRNVVTAFLRGLSEIGYVEGRSFFKLALIPSRSAFSPASTGLAATSRVFPTSAAQWRPSVSKCCTS